MIIDEKKDITPYTAKENKKTYTDHNMMAIQLNWVTTSIKQNDTRTRITQEGKEKLQQETMNSKLTEIWTGEGTMQEKYTEWNNEVIKITKDIFTTKTRKRPMCREINQLRKKGSNLKVECK